AVSDQEYEWNESEDSRLAERLDNRIVDHQGALELEVVGCIERKGNDRTIDTDAEKWVSGEHCHPRFDRRNPLLKRIVLVDVAEAITACPRSGQERQSSCQQKADGDFQ